MPGIDGRFARAIIYPDPEAPFLHRIQVKFPGSRESWTDECFGMNGRSAITSLIDVARGIVPRNVVNGEALRHERLRHLQEREMK